MPKVSEMHWISDQDRVVCRGDRGVVFEDTAEHWREAVLRLLNLTEETGQAWVEAVADEAQDHSEIAFLDQSPDQRIEILARASRRTFPSPAPGNIALDLDPAIRVLGTPLDQVWCRGLRDDPAYAIVGNRDIQHGILMQLRAGVWERVTPIPYEEAYFEGDQIRVGYGGYRAQASWRLEKAARLIRQILGIAQLAACRLKSGARLLDVGSGYGYLRKAALDGGLASDGVEVSRHAASVARAEFGMETFVGTLEDFYRQQGAQEYDFLTLFDVIEHVEDPVLLLQVARHLLRPGGLCVIRTPNLIAIEAEIFGSYYHSIKMEHLHYFSPASLCFALERADLKPAFLTTESHLLRGFLGKSLESYARRLRGSDLFAVAQKT
jgi:2-polyprenyl-3-methyl-5-hydroxy-6-metoxy-1,4-benzoquinol methylase